jgi:ubiquitin
MDIAYLATAPSVSSQLPKTTLALLEVAAIGDACSF